MYSHFFLSPLSSRLEYRAQQSEGERRTTFWAQGPEHGKICRGFSDTGVKSYDNRSVKRVRGYFIITDCTQTSVHYAHLLFLSFSSCTSLLFAPLPRSLFIPPPFSFSVSFVFFLPWRLGVYIPYYGIKGKGLALAAQNPGRKSTSSYSLQCLRSFSATSLRPLVGYGISS